MTSFIFVVITRLFFLGVLILLGFIVYASLQTEKENKLKHLDYESKRRK